MAALIKDRGVRPWITLTCRDRNRVVLEQELVGLTVLGVDGVLCVTGDARGPGVAAEATQVFDLDGTLADTDPLHLAAFNRVLGPHGHSFDHARFGRELQGFSNASIGERFLAHVPPERRAGILSEKERIFRELVSGQIVPVPGLMALLDRADRAASTREPGNRPCANCRCARHLCT